jgi:hypothetical protein
MTDIEQLQHSVEPLDAFTTDIFVFGSNLAGRHGKGAALEARKNYGAIYGVGTGRQGSSYAIPTKDVRLRTLPLDVIREYVEEFKQYARRYPRLRFLVTRVGCGLAGYTDADMAPLFKDCPDNCILPDRWRK